MSLGPFNTHQPNDRTIMELQDELSRVCKERDDALAKLHESEAKGAEMSNCLREVKIRIAYIGMPQEPFWTDGNRVIWDWRPQIALLEHALSSDLGKGWKSPEEYAALETKNAELSDAIRLTISENLHLADGENCTLRRLTRINLSDSNCAKTYFPVAELEPTIELLVFTHENWPNVMHDATSTCRFCKEIARLENLKKGARNEA